MNDIIEIKNNIPSFKSGTKMREIFDMVPPATPQQVLEQLGLLFVGLQASDKNLDQMEKKIRLKLYFEKISLYPDYAIRKAVDKFVDNSIFVPAISDLVKEIRNQVCINIKWVD